MRRSTRGRWLAVAGAALAVLLVWTLGGPGPAGTPGGPGVPEGGAAAGSGPVAAPRPVPSPGALEGTPTGAPEGGAAPDAHERDVPRPAPPPESLRGTEVDGALVADADGRFVPTPSALRLFDYFLTARGEEPEARILARIEAEIARQLPASARAGARALLADHLAYRREARRLHAEGLGAADLETRLQRVRELRRGVFGARTAELLFGEEEQLARVALAVRRLEQDPELGAAERAARRAALEAELPESVREVHRRATLPGRLAREEAALREQGASAAEIRALREARVGPEAARRLEALERRRAEWDARLARYREERRRLEDAPGTDPEAVEALRRRHFEGPELVRVRALDRVDATTP